MKPNFQAMNKTELKTYLLDHRNDQEAFYAYMDKLANETVIAVHSPSDTEPLIDVIERVRKQQAKTSEEHKVN